MPAVNSKPTGGGLPLRTLGSAALLSLAVVAYSYTQHRRTAEKAKKSMLNASDAVSGTSMGNLRGAAAASSYTAAQWTEADERERRFDRDAEYFSPGLIDKTAAQPGDAAEASEANAQQRRKHSGGVSAKLDRAFLQQLRALRRILIPSLASKEAAIIATHTLFLVLRTWLSVIVAELDGKIVKHLVRGQGGKFLTGLVSWFAIAVPATYTNSMIRFLECKLALAFRTRLTQYVHDLYLADSLTYHKLLALDRRIANPDQFITTDIARFCTKLAAFLSNLGKPTLDTVVFNIQLVRGVALQGTLGMFAMYMATASLLRAWTPPFGKMAAAQAKLEGEFRANHSRVITNAEEIAFYRGEKREEEQLQGSLQRLLAHARSVASRKISHVVLEDMVIKYTWSAFGYLACALPFFVRPAAASDGGSRTQRFVTNKRILVNLSDAGGRIMYSIKEAMELTGYTSRVYSLISTLHALRRDEYEKPSAQDPSLYPDFALSTLQGALYEDIDGIRFTNVPIVAPSVDPDVAGELLVRPLTWEVRRGQHWMISGPNGVGKTSVLRVLSGLWPVFSGIVERPEPAEIIYIPQRPYLALGTLRDQIIYPHTHAQMQALGRTDEELVEVLHAVHLSYLPAREGGLAARKEWKDVLSGGEKQRINLARLFYHLPRFAVLDECTSAVSADVEGLMYEHAKRLGITLITISHRPALYKYHTYLLRLGVAESPAASRPDSSRRTKHVLSAVSRSAEHGASDYDEEEEEEEDKASRALTMSTTTEPWESDIDEFGSLGESVESGVLWDVVRLSNSASMDIHSSAVSSSPPLSSASSVSSLESSPKLGPHLPHNPPAAMRAVISTTDMARKGSMDAIRTEIEQLRSALAAKKAMQADLESRLAHVQRELTAVVL